MEETLNMLSKSYLFMILLKVKMTAHGHTVNQEILACRKNREFSVGTTFKHGYIRKILFYHSNLTKKLKFPAAKLSWFTVFANSQSYLWALRNRLIIVQSLQKVTVCVHRKYVYSGMALLVVRNIVIPKIMWFLYDVFLYKKVNSQVFYFSSGPVVNNREGPIQS